MKKKITIVRPINLAIVALTMSIVLFKFKSPDLLSHWMDAILLILPAVLTAAAGYVINDIFDVEADKINKPHLLTVGKFISKQGAWILYGILTVFSLCISWYFSFRYMNVNLSIVIMLAIYAIRLKGLPLIGNIVVAICSASVIAICLLKYHNKISFVDFPAYSFLNFLGYIIFAFLTSLIREMVKDLQDMEGDRAIGLKTYAIVMGEKGSKILIFVVMSILIMLCGVYAVLTWGIGMKICSVIMSVIVVSLFYFINHLSNAKTNKAYHGSSELLKYIMVLGIINLLFI